MKKFGFTLAEVLITLGVIGVVSAMTLPTLIQSHQKQVTVNKLKETYSTLSQAFQRAVADHDAPANWTYDDNNLDLFVENYLAPYLKIISKSTKSPVHYYSSGAQIDNYAYGGRTHYYLSNGVELTIYPYETTHYLIIADINGTKGPNRFGRDLFQFQFQKNSKSLSITKSFTLNGAYNDMSDFKANCSKNGTALGDHCGAWIMREGWKIPKDYPW